MAARFEDEITRLYADAFEHLSRLLHAPGATSADRERARDALARLHRAYAHVGMKNLAQRAAELNALASALRNVTGHAQGELPTADLASLHSAADEARRLLVRAAREAFPADAGAAPNDDDPDASRDIHVDPNDRSGSSADARATARISPERRAEYEDMFATCVVRPDKISTVNWYANKAIEYRERYARAGMPLGVPWWFIGAVHALESGFAFDRHLHNGDPLTARTRHVPPGRPATGEPPFAWEDSARDALQYMQLDTWREWSVAGALYQWEAYNGPGYRKYKVPSPYLWSFSNHYDKGRYVRDHVFDSEAVSNQCGAAVLLRTLVNRGAVKLP
jgi:lysozyme family protein